jgi:ADP-ribose pyrophosphatase
MSQPPERPHAHEYTETVTSSERLYQGRVITLDRLQVTLSSGVQATRELVRHPGAVAIVPIIGRDVLLVTQYRTAAGRVMLEIPAGTLNPAETPPACAERELQEETGYRPGRLEPLGGFFVAPGYTTEFIHLFVATDLVESRLAMDEDEQISVERVPFEDALARIASGAIIDGKTIIGLLRARDLVTG